MIMMITIMVTVTLRVLAHTYTQASLRNINRSFKRCGWSKSFWSFSGNNDEDRKKKLQQLIGKTKEKKCSEIKL